MNKAINNKCRSAAWMTRIDEGPEVIVRNEKYELG